MPTTKQKPKNARSKVLGAQPQLFTTDLDASFAFFTRKLGFSIALRYGDPPFYGQVERGEAQLNLRVVDEHAIPAEIRDREQMLSATVILDDAEPLYAEFAANGVDFAQPLRTEPWGARTFIVRDPDGNLILFAS